jgi:hypothetical protein
MASLGLALAGSALGSGTKGWLSHGAHDLTDASQRLHVALTSSVTSTLITGMTRETSMLFQPGASNLSGGEIFAQYGKAGFTSIAHGLAGGLSEFATDQVARARAEQGPQTEESEHAGDEHGALPVKKPKPGAEVSPEELDAQLELVRKEKTRPVSDPELRGDYVEEADGPDGSTWRRRRDGSWCRFASPGVCTLDFELFPRVSKTNQAKIRRLIVKSGTLDSADVTELLAHPESHVASVVTLLDKATPDDIARVAAMVKARQMPVTGTLVEMILEANPTERADLIDRIGTGRTKIPIELPPMRSFDKSGVLAGSDKDPRWLMTREEEADYFQNNPDINREAGHRAATRFVPEPNETKRFGPREYTWDAERNLVEASTTRLTASERDDVMYAGTPGMKPGEDYGHLLGVDFGHIDAQTGRYGGFRQASSVNRPTGGGTSPEWYTAERVVLEKALRLQMAGAPFRVVARAEGYVNGVPARTCLRLEVGGIVVHDSGWIANPVIP